MRLLYTEISPLLDSEDLFRQKIKEVSPFRREKVMRLFRQEDRCLSLAAGLLLFASAEKEGIELIDDKIRYGKNGKPEWIGEPAFCFSLSHSGKYAVCASSSVPIGCDVEKIGSFREEICRKYYSEEEREAVLSLSSEKERKALFTKIWTLKESFFKCTGEGLSSAETMRSRSFSGLDAEPYIPEFKDFRFYSPALFEDAFVSVCLYRSDPSERIEIKAFEIAKR